MRTAVVIAASVAFASCADQMWRSRARLESARTLSCPAEKVTVHPWNYDTGTARTEGCEREAMCVVKATGGIESAYVACEETPTSNEKTLAKVVTDRLALETGCPATEIRIDQATEWSRGTERAYRMTACAKSYVCTTAPGRTDCEPALVSDAKP